MGEGEKNKGRFIRPFIISAIFFLRLGQKKGALELLCVRAASFLGFGTAAFPGLLATFFFMSAAA